MARAGRGFLLKPLRPIVRKTGAPGVATVAGDVALIATSTLTAAATDTVLPAVALVAASSLTSAASAAAASLAATSSLTTTATITKFGAVALVASSTLTPTMAPATVVSLSAVSSLSADAATLITAAVALGVVTVVAGPVTALAMVQPGTLANPYAATDSDTRSLDFASALFVATEPVAITGPPAAPSIWYEFTESQVADWLASTSSFAHGAVIELYAGPPGAGPDDLTFIATDGSSLVTLGAVTLSALVTTVATSLRAELVDLGAVAVAASPAVAAVLT